MQELDQALLLAINFDGGTAMDNIFWVISQKLTWVPLYIFLIYLLYRRFSFKQATIALIMCVVMVALCDQSANFFKTFTPKFRPTHTDEISHLVHTVRDYRGGLYGTVSAHAAISFALATFISSLIRKKWLMIALYIWAATVAYSRIYLGVHYPMDITLGAIDGLIMAFISLKLFHYFTRSRETT